MAERRARLKPGGRLIPVEITGHECHPFEQPLGPETLPRHGNHPLQVEESRRHLRVPLEEGNGIRPGAAPDVEEPGEPAAIKVLDALHVLGIRLSIDDFGTGYSSLSYLKRFPVDRLKIDQSFVRDIDSDTDDAAIVSAIIAMARSLDLEIVAEGVEKEAHRDFLLGLNCYEAQGFLYSRPLPPDEVEAILRAGVIDVMASS